MCVLIMFGCFQALKQHPIVQPDTCICICDRASKTSKPDPWTREQKQTLAAAQLFPALLLRQNTIEKAMTKKCVFNI